MTQVTKIMTKIMAKVMIPDLQPGTTTMEPEMYRLVWQ